MIIKIIFLTNPSIFLSQNVPKKVISVVIVHININLYMTSYYLLELESHFLK